MEIERLRGRTHFGVACTALTAINDDGRVSSTERVFEELVEGRVHSVVRAVGAVAKVVTFEIDFGDEVDGAAEGAVLAEDTEVAIEADDDPDGGDDVRFDVAPDPTQLVPVNPAGVVGFVLA